MTLDGALGVANLYDAFQFNGGTAQSFAQLLSQVALGTSSLAGSSGNLILRTAASTSISGGSGHDSIFAAGSADTVIGGAGSNQYLVAAGNADSVVGGSGADTLYGYGQNDTLSAGSGITTMYGGLGFSGFFVVNNTADVVLNYGYAGASVDTVSSSVSYTLPSLIDVLQLTGTAAIVGTGNGDSDTLIAGAGADTLVSSTGHTYFAVNRSSDVVVESSGTAVDTIASSFNYTLPANVTTLILTSAALTGTAGAGADTLVANGNNDTLIGGSGNDTFVLNGTGDVVQDTATTTQNTIESNVSFSLPSGINGLTLMGTANLVGTANSGNDTLASNAGIDTLVGGSGNDTFIVVNARDVIQDTSTTASNLVQTAVSYTLPTNVNALTFTGSANLTGGANGGADTLTSNSGVDTLSGGAGNDTFVISNAGDVIQDTSSTASNTARSSVSYTLATNVNSLILTGTAALVGTANAGHDTLTANTGADTLKGGSGNDTFVVNSTSDVVQDTYTTTSNTLSSTVSFTLPTNVNSLLFTGTAALKGTANSGNDLLTANTGADTLVAGSGADTLVGGTAGIDSLVGGTGTDVFEVNLASDVVSVAAASNDTIQATVNYTLPTNVNSLLFTGTAALKGTGNAGNDRLAANAGADTLVAGNGTDTLVSGSTGTDSLVGGTGSDLFIVNVAADIVTVGSSHGADSIQAAVSYTASANVADLIMIGSANIAGTGNTLANVLTITGTGTDTLTAGTGLATLQGGAGNDTFVIDSASDVVQDTFTTTSNTLSTSTVSYTLPTNVNSLLFTGTAALTGTANSGNDLLTANSGADTLKAGTGADTLVAGTAGADSLVGGTGTDVFEVNNTADKVSVASAGNDTLQSSVSYTLPTNVPYMLLTGTAALAATGNSALDLIIGNTGADTLTGGTGIAVLEGGKTAGSDQIKAPSNQAALIAGGASATLTGAAFKDFFAAGHISDSITTGATANVISVNKGDGADTISAVTSSTDVLSLGAGIDAESLTFTKSGNNLVLNDGVSGDSITLANWFAGASDQDVTKLQVVEIASSSYNSGGSDPLRNKPLEEFNFTALASAYVTAGEPSNWSLTGAMPSATITSSTTAAYGGDLAYYFGLNGNLTGVNLSAAQSTLTNASYATALQTIDSFSSISGGPVSLLLAPRLTANDTAVASAAVSTADPAQSTVSGNTDSAAILAPSLSSTADIKVVSDPVPAPNASPSSNAGPTPQPDLIQVASLPVPLPLSASPVATSNSTVEQGPVIHGMVTYLNWIATEQALSLSASTAGAGIDIADDEALPSHSDLVSAAFGNAMLQRQTRANLLAR